ncbi:MAG: hypothetical protein AAF944_16325 [Bacteroidota bacterium]
MNFLRANIAGLLLILSVSCSKQATMPPTTDTAPVIIYRTKADYSQCVPVRLSDDGSRIVAYPAPGDVMSGSSYRYPISLKKDYYWDQQGVGPTTAFLSITYEEYAALKTTPDPKDLLVSILDRNPFLEMYHAGRVSDYREIEPELNKIIAQNRLNQLTSLLSVKGE